MDYIIFHGHTLGFRFSPSSVLTSCVCSLSLPCCCPTCLSLRMDPHRKVSSLGEVPPLLHPCRTIVASPSLLLSLHPTSCLTLCFRGATARVYTQLAEHYLKILVFFPVVSREPFWTDKYLACGVLILFTFCLVTRQ